MKLFFYKTFLRLTVIIVWCLYPLTAILAPLFSAWAKKRKEFELRNHSDPAARGHDKADICFEVSSEGELEQVLPLVEHFISKNLIVELVYSSESVENKVKALGQKYFNNLFIFRLPLLTFSPFYNLNWVKAETLVLCRYDFYPHLILLGLKKKKFVLLSASLKGKENPSSLPYEFFDLIVCSSDREKKAFEKLLGQDFPLMTLDIRIMRIISRLENSQEALKKVSGYLEKLANIPRKSRIILGSAYPEEMKVFENKKFVSDLQNNQIHLCIAPHKLDQESVANILKLIPEQLHPISIKDNLSDPSFSSVTLMLVPGILCELYLNFGHAYVGGGHLKSIHSVLEPYLGGAWVYCGPKTHRSTEFDFILGQSNDNITVVKNIKDFYDDVKEGKEIKGPPDQKGFKEDLEKLISFF